MGTKIAFTSCCRIQAFDEQPQWRDIENADPDYLFLLGDQIYMDFGLPPFSKVPNGRPMHYSLEKFKEAMAQLYSKQWGEKHFQSLFEKMKAKNGVFGIWDDHDFGWNNAYGNSAKMLEDNRKFESRKLFHRYMDCSTNEPEIYCHVDIPHARVIFLDTRFYADPENPRNPYERDLLGEEQFQFIEEKMNHDKQYTILCSGITFKNGKENWQKFPKDFARLSQLISQKERVVFLAGDVHKNRLKEPGPVRPCYEIISSGIAVNKVGIGLAIDDLKNWGLLDIDESGIKVSLKSRFRLKQYVIDSQKWKVTWAS